jgi:hypothetical protein
MAYVPRTKSVSTPGLRNKKLLKKALEPNRLNAVLPPSQEAIRRALEARLCPWCGKGPWDSIAGHTVRAHGVDRKELRDLAGLTYSVSLTSDRLHQRNKDRARERGAPDGHLGKGKTKVLSKVAQKIARDKIRAVQSVEQREQALQAAHTPEAQAKRSSSLRQSYDERLGGPPQHGTDRMYRSRGCRCDQCRAWNTRNHREYLASRPRLV